MEQLLRHIGPAKMGAEICFAIVGLSQIPTQIIDPSGVAPYPLGSYILPRQADPDGLRRVERLHQVADELAGGLVNGGEPGAGVHHGAVVVRQQPGARLGRDQVAAVLVSTPAGRTVLLS